MDDLTTKLAEALRLISFASMDRGARDTATEALRLYEQAKAQPVQDLPPLPEPIIKESCPDGDYEGWTAEQMRDHCRAGYIAGLEAAASAIEPKCEPEDWTEYAGDCASLARIIRNLKGQP